ncbi:MAG: hypothetical protein RLZZ142_108 [Verrucomicrobiota bacterium]|jgi:23S rRNA (cytosine1962-C5)-methyltransferase
MEEESGYLIELHATCNASSSAAMARTSNDPAPLLISPQLWNQLASTGTSAHRVYSTPGGWIERLGDDLLLNYQTPALLSHLQAVWDQNAPSFSFSPQRIFGRLMPLQNAERSAPVLLSGDPALPLETTVRENQLRFGIDFSAGYSVGLFLDQRLNRSLLRSFAPRLLLNTFAYTCAFSVAAASQNAKTLSVDLSQKSLDRGRANFALNQLDPSSHRFLAEDVLELLPRLARRREQFDTLILDPPTFSRGHKGRRFRAEDDLQSLLLLALEVAAPRAHILLSTNCTKLALPELQTMARLCLKSARRSATLQPSPPPPDFPPGAGSSTLWIHLQ